VIVGDLLIWRNRDHLTATYARQLAPSMAALVKTALVGRARVPLAMHVTQTE
jgi:hypothetical protein